MSYLLYTNSSIISNHQPMLLNYPPYKIVFILPLSSLKTTQICNYRNKSSQPTFNTSNLSFSTLKLIDNSKSKKYFGGTFNCKARRRVRYDADDDNEDEDFGYNQEISLLEIYSQSAREEALLVTALLDDHEVVVLIYKGFSSCLSGKTSSDPSKSVLPQRAIIKTIDKIRGPFNPTHIEYIEKDLSWEEFKDRLLTN